MFVVAIPSYQRAHTLKKKTISFLEQNDLLDRVTVFVANDQELRDYEKVLPTLKLVVGVPGITAQREFIRHFYPEGTRVLSIDDDVDGIKTLIDKPFTDIVEDMFHRTEAAGLTVWGFYPVNNLFFCKKRIVRGLAFIIGQLYGFINKHESYGDKEYKSPTKSDVWYSLYRYEKDGGVLRNESVCINSTMGRGKGGLQAYRTNDTEQRSAEELVTLFPKLCKIKEKRRGWDVILTNKRRYYISLVTDQDANGSIQ